MKRALPIILSVFFYSQILFAQRFSIANDKCNLLYIGVSNPLSIAVENISFNSLVVKASNGIIRKDGNKYFYYVDSSVGKTDIILYKKVNYKLKEIGRSEFRVYRTTLPVFKIGSGKSLITANELAQQNYCRAVLENIDLDRKFPIEQFTVQIFSNDSSRSVSKINYGDKLSNEIKQVFKSLKPGDVIILKNILIKLLTEDHVELDSRIINIKE